MSQSDPRLGAVVSHYRVLERLGSGGMGVVYKAEDTRLHRYVAVKFLPEKSIDDQRAVTRFRREAYAASSLDHPNICTVYDFDEAGGQPFIVMQLLEGKTLRQLMKQNLLPLETVLDFSMQIASALDAAHRRGIVHRDLKPNNIMVTNERRVSVLDFGLAKLFEPTEAIAQIAGVGVDDTTLEVEHSSRAGTVFGTPAYMSPEQASAERVDARSDIFSFGAILYEMLSGRAAFERETPHATLTAVLHAEPPSPGKYRPGLSASIERCVQRCLQKDPSRRFENIQELRAELSRAGGSRDRDAAPSLAVLPFANLSADKDNEYFSDGLAEEILNALAKISGLRVIARTSSFAFRGTQRDLRAIANRLNVANILEGSIRKAGDRVRITAQLIRADDESHLWSERYDRQMTDIFAIQDEISQAIAGALKVKLAKPARRPVSMEAYHNYLKGLYHHQRYSHDGLEKAKEFFEQALAEDPSYAPAYAGLAGQYYTLALLGIRSMRDVAPLAKSAAEKALALDPALGDAHSILGVVAAISEYDWRTAEQHFQTALSIEPVSALVRVRYVLYFRAWHRQYEGSDEHCRKALETDPLSMIVHFLLVMLSCWKGNFEQARQLGAKALLISDNFVFVQLAMGVANFHLGYFEESAKNFQKTVDLGWYSLGPGFLALVYTRAGNREAADRLMQQLEERKKTSYVSAVSFAVYYASLGDSDRFFQFLMVALSDRDPYLLGIIGDPVFDSFRADPRYRRIIAEMHLE